MGKAKRLRQQRHAHAATPHTKVMDAAQVIGMVERVAALVEGPQPIRDREWRHAGQLASVMLADWRRSPVVVRADADFAAALAGSDTDTELVPDWLERMPFDSFACSLATPLVLDDGSHVCHYVGFIATGIRSKRLSEAGEDRLGRAWTTYGPLREADGIRFLWVYNHERDPTPRVQTSTVLVKGELARANTISDLVMTQERVNAEYGMPWGRELHVLVPFAIQLSLYMVAQEPDLEWIPAEQRSRHRELTSAKVGNVGWRVGAAVRSWRPGPATGVPRESRSGWRLPPHIRRAHWMRVRVATRDEAGNIIGNRLGEFGVDWNYELRWIPPTPVNVSDQAPADPAVRDIEP